VRLTRRNTIAVAKPLPGLRVSAADGCSIHLADLRGKYVLLNASHASLHVIPSLRGISVSAMAALTWRSLAGSG